MKLEDHTVQQTVSSNDATIHNNIRITTSIKIEAYKLDILVTDKKNKLIIIIEIRG